MADFLALSARLGDVDRADLPSERTGDGNALMPSAEAPPDPFSLIVMFFFALWQNAPLFLIFLKNIIRKKKRDQLKK